MIDFDSIFQAFLKGKMSRFYDIMYPGLLLFAARTLGDRMAYLAEDCVQEAIMSTFLNRDKMTDASHWKAFLITSVRNRALKMVRHDEVEQNYLANSDNEIVERELTYAIIRQETLDLLYAAIEELPEEYRQIFDLSFEQGLRNPEVAKLLNIAEITVKKRKARMIDLLRKRLGKSSDEIIALLIAADIAMRA